MLLDRQTAETLVDGLIANIKQFDMSSKARGAAMDCVELKESGKDPIQFLLSSSISESQAKIDELLAAIAQAEKIKNRVKVSFKTLNERNEFAAHNECGTWWNENGMYHCYVYSAIKTVKQIKEEQDVKEKAEADKKLSYKEAALESAKLVQELVNKIGRTEALAAIVKLTSYSGHNIDHYIENGLGMKHQANFKEFMKTI